MTRPRPGIDRVSSAWLIGKFIDPKARFVFCAEASHHPEAVPFDIHGSEMFGHRGNHCTFETLREEFGIDQERIRVMAEIIHDIDFHDDKFERPEGVGIDKILRGWAKEDISDQELLERGISLMDGLYFSI